MSEKDIVGEARELISAIDNHTLDKQEKLRELLRALADEVERLRKQQDRDSTCVVCSATLLEAEEPPHCIDCFVTDEDRERWEDSK